MSSSVPPVSLNIGIIYKFMLLLFFLVLIIRLLSMSVKLYKKFLKESSMNNSLKSVPNDSCTLRKRLRIRSVISVNYKFITVLCPFNLLIRFKCYNTV